jgi:hypothetical protein
MAFDEATGKVLLFGGYETYYPTGSSLAYARQLGDTWSWDGTRWSAEQSTASPAARTDAAMAYDAVRRVVVLHGGQGVTSGFVNDTWTWNGTRWILMSPDNTPPAMWGEHQPISWDGAHKVVLLFDWTGQWTAPGELNQTWEWDGTNWTLLPAADAPSGHTAVQAAIAYDTARRSTVFFGHVGGRPTTWTFDGTAWTKASSSGSASMNFSLAADGARSVLVLFGQNGDTWTWNGTKWTPQAPAHSPSPRFGASMAYDSIHHVVVLFGGRLGSLGQLNDTWTWNGIDWTQVATP